MDWKLVLIVGVLTLWNCHLAASFSPPHVQFNSSFHNESSAGESGQVCTGIGRRCVTNFTCVDHECVCPPGMQGTGEFECVPDDSLLCTVLADPHLRAFENARVGVNLPCRYRLTKYVREVPDISAPDCSVEVFATNELAFGMYYVHSLHISIGINRNAENRHNAFEIRKYGTSDLKVYKYLSEVKHSSIVWGTGEHHQVEGVDIFVFFDLDNNFAVLDVPTCDTRIKFRPYDQSNYPQILMPGISIMAPNISKFPSQEGKYPGSLCGTDEDGEDLFDDRAQYLGLKDKRLAVIYDILNEGHSQVDNPNKGKCDDAIQTFQLSANKVADINYCGDIVIHGRTRKCLSKGASIIRPTEVFTACLRLQQGTQTAADCTLISNGRAKCGDRWKGPNISC